MTTHCVHTMRHLIGYTRQTTVILLPIYTLHAKNALPALDKREKFLGEGRPLPKPHPLDARSPYLEILATPLICLRRKAMSLEALNSV
jgi:hypothetical protein